MIGIQLVNPLVIIDLEATGLKISEARIIQIGMVKLHPSGAVEQFEAMVNPMCQIPSEIEELTGITINDVRDQPSFMQIADQVARFIDGCDLAGYNIRRFDLPLLSEEMSRCGIVGSPADDVLVVDAQVIFHTEEPRTLSAAYKTYTGKIHSASHKAMGDVMATIEVLDKQLIRYSHLPRTVEGLHEYSLRGKDIADHAGLFYRSKEGFLAWNFGKYKDKPVSDEPNYCQWFLRESFPYQSKRILAEYMDMEYLLDQFYSPSTY